MKNYRCCSCEKLLFRMTGEAVVAVKCPRCKTVNQITPECPERPTLTVKELYGCSHHTPNVHA